VRVRQVLSELVLTLGAIAGLLITYALPVRWVQGPEGKWWESLRRHCSQRLGQLDEQAGPRPITKYEYAGALDHSVEETEQMLWKMGFVRNPFARLKTRSGEPEAGSWAYRESPLAPRQLHLMLFEREDGGTDVYAHEELSSVHPLCAPDHFRGCGQSVGAGVRRTREWLTLDTTNAPENPPDGSWHAMPDAVSCERFMQPRT